MKIDGREIGPGHPPYIVGEISGEHCGSYSNAMALIRAAKAAGADAVKIQAFDPERLAKARGGGSKVLSEGLWGGRSLIDLYRETHTPASWGCRPARLQAQETARNEQPKQTRILPRLGRPAPTADRGEGVAVSNRRMPKVRRGLVRRVGR